MPTRNDSSPKCSSKRIRVLVVDDHPVIRQVLANVIEDKLDVELCGEACSSTEALWKALKLRPDVAVVDISLADVHGLDLVLRIRVQLPQTHVVVFSMHDENVFAERALRAGASGYLMKTEPTQSVIEAIRRAHRGEVYLSPRMASLFFGNARTDGAQGPQFAVDELTGREWTVFRLMGEGLTSEEIQEELDLNRKTVETYRRRAKEKLGLDSVTDLLQYAVQWTSGRLTSERPTAEGREAEQHPEPDQAA